MLISKTCPEKFLIPLQAVSPSEKLLLSVAENGVLVPAIICEGMLVDGHQRIKAALNAGKKGIPTIEVEGNPFMLFAELNQHRQLYPLETAIAYAGIEDKHLKKEFCGKIGLSESPQMSKSLIFIAQNYLKFPAQNFNSLPLNIWRELGHIEKNYDQILTDFLRFEGTIGEKRLIAGLLRQCARKTELPEKFPSNEGKAIISFLNSIVQPRRSQALEKYEKTISNLKIPAGINIKIDSTFSKPGIDIQIHVKRNSLERFNQAGELARKIFTEVEEL